MHFSSLLPSLALMASPAVAAVFFVGTYSGTIASVDLNEYTGALKLLSSVDAPASSWQGLSPTTNILYSIEENIPTDSKKGGVTSYSICSNGTLIKISTATGLVGPVSLGISQDGTTIFTANYGGSGISLYKSTPAGKLTWVRDWTYTLSSPGAVPDRQDVPHPHQALFDSTGKFVVVPDLGADKIRVFSYAGAELPTITVPPGTGPRHGAFFPAKGKASSLTPSASSPFPTRATTSSSHLYSGSPHSLLPPPPLGQPNLSYHQMDGLSTSLTGGITYFLMDTVLQRISVAKMGSWNCWSTSRVR
jgi:DNA-binding beta-propeller fold protein YncE